MLTITNLNNTLRAIASALQMPVTIILILLIAVTIVMAGTLIAEIFTERRHMCKKLPELLSALEAGEKSPSAIIKEGGLLRRQTKLLLTVCRKTDLSALKREALAGELIEAEQAHYDLRVKITDLVMKLGPMFGLLGTLIPLGPGIIALGRGDTYTLSTSLLTAFDTTIAGLIAAAAATLISSIRKRWYSRYMGQLGTVMESLLEAMEGKHEAA
jgi:biopolymer transport protein ExbB/TolQ